MTESARSRRRRELGELVDESDPLELARVLVNSVDEDTEKSATVWLLKAIALAQIDQAETARVSVFQPESSAAPSASHSNHNVLCQCSHLGYAHVQGNGECLIATCGCEAFRGG